MNIEDRCKRIQNGGEKIYSICKKIYLVLMSIALIILSVAMIIHFIIFQTLFIPFSDIHPFVSLLFLLFYVRGAYDVFSYFRKKRNRVK